jgi:hypothetical protein
MNATVTTKKEVMTPHHRKMEPRKVGVRIGRFNFGRNQSLPSFMPNPIIFTSTCSTQEGCKYGWREGGGGGGGGRLQGTGTGRRLSEEKTKQNGRLSMGVEARERGGGGEVKG